MLPRYLSLKSEKQIDYILKRGDKVSSAYFMFVTLPVRQGEMAKVLCMSSKKKMRTSPLRNRLRRRSYALFLEYREYFCDTHLVILPRKRVGDLDFSTLQKDFRYLMHQLKK